MAEPAAPCRRQALESRPEGLAVPGPVSRCQLRPYSSLTGAATTSAVTAGVLESRGRACRPHPPVLPGGMYPIKRDTPALKAVSLHFHSLDGPGRGLIPLFGIFF